MNEMQPFQIVIVIGVVLAALPLLLGAGVQAWKKLQFWQVQREAEAHSREYEAKQAKNACDAAEFDMRKHARQLVREHRRMRGLR